MELLRVVKRRSVLSETVYILLNLALAAGVVVLTIATSSPLLAIILVVLSKWRVFAVRPRYWFAHVEANMVDVFVSISTVLLIYLAGQGAAGSGLGIQIVLGVIYACWLLFLKPRSKRSYIAAQAAIAMTVGTIMLASLSYSWPSSLVVIIMWLLGYSCARHVLMSYSDSDTRLLSLIWGFITAEIGWITYHWTMAYNLPFLPGLKLPQVTILLLGISFLAERAYSSLAKNEKIRLGDMMLPLILVLGVFVILLSLYNSAGIGSA